MTRATRALDPTPARVSRLPPAAPRPPGPAPRRVAHRFSSRGSGFWRRDSDACRAPGDASRGASRFADRVRDREGGRNVCSCVRTSLMACATTSNPRAPRVERPRAAFMASPRLCASLPKPTDLACVRTGNAATAPLDATGARADATTPTAPSALQEIAAMMVDERTLGVSERDARRRMRQKRSVAEKATSRPYREIGKTGESGPLASVVFFGGAS